MTENFGYFFYGAPLRVRLSQGMSLQERLSLTGNNTGNMFIAAAVERHLGAPREAELIGREIDVERVNREYDKVVIPASNFVNSYSDFGRVAEIIKKIKIPIVVIGIGSQASQFTDTIEVKKGTLDFLKALSERSITLGVRGNFTAEKLFEIGIRNVDVIGCPTLYYNSRPDFQVTKKDISGSFRAAINFGRRKENLHLLGIAMKKNLPFIAQSELLEMAVMDGTANVRDVAHDPLYRKSPSLRPEKIVNYLKQNGRAFYDILEWIQEVSSYDFILGPRLHGNMIAFQNGVPALWFSHDTRTREICDLARLPSLPISEIKNYNCVEEYYAVVDFGDFNREYPLLYNNYIAFLEKNNLKHNLKKADTSEVWSQVHAYHVYCQGKERLMLKNRVGEVSPPALAPRPPLVSLLSVIKNNPRIILWYLLLMRHPMFDAEWYAEQYLKKNGTHVLNPLWHYLTVGWMKGFSPGPLFDIRWYLAQNLDVAAAGVEPLSHYITRGWREGRSPNPIFNITWFTKTYQTSLPRHKDPFTYYLKTGWKAGQIPSQHFRNAWYVKKNPKIKIDPFTHYMKYGWKNGLSPSPSFNAQAYLERYPDVKVSGMEPLTHYLRFGKKEGRIAE